MHKVIIALAGAASVLACGSSSSPGGEVVLPGAVASGGASGAPETLLYFEGSVDAARQRMDITYRSPTGEIVSGRGVTPSSVPSLPYGTGSDQVYFHTNSAGFTGGVVSGNVNGVNGYQGAVLNLTAVIDSVSSAAVTNPGSFAHGTANGSLGTGALHISNALTWSFSDPSATSFTFAGHATGTAPPTSGIAVVVATFGHNNTPVCTSSCTSIPLGGPAGSGNRDTTTVAQACNGLASCTWPAGGISIAAALPADGDPSVCCYKDFEVSWLCNGVKANNSPIVVCPPGANCEGAAQGNLQLTCP